jgi:hypothetical protein
VLEALSGDLGRRFGVDYRSHRAARPVVITCWAAAVTLMLGGSWRGGRERRVGHGDPALHPARLPGRGLQRRDRSGECRDGPADPAQGPQRAARRADLRPGRRPAPGPDGRCGVLDGGQAPGQPLAHHQLPAVWRPAAGGRGPAPGAGVAAGADVRHRCSRSLRTRRPRAAGGFGWSSSWDGPWGVRPAPDGGKTVWCALTL